MATPTTVSIPSSEGDTGTFTADASIANTDGTITVTKTGAVITVTANPVLAALKTAVAGMSGTITTASLQAAIAAIVMP